jgi:hypothetical protein
MATPKILVQLDPDPHPSVFDSVVAVDSGVDQLLRHSAVEPDAVRDLVHGAIFTRGVSELRHTAIFVGGSSVDAGERLASAVVKSFVGPMRVSVMIDSNGANTTAAAAVLAAGRHVELSGAAALVLPGTGPVGQRAVRLLAREGATVHVGSRRFERAQEVCERVWELVEGATLVPHATGASDGLSNALKDAQVVIAAGAAGVEVLPQDVRKSSTGLRVAIDLNAVPPVGIAGIEVVDKGKQRDGTIAYGAIGVGGMKMKIHRAAVRRLFETNGAVLDAEEIYAIGRELEAG